MKLYHKSYELPQVEWLESSKRWRIRVQINGVRRAFYSSNPSIRAGRAECRKKAMEWIEQGARQSSPTVKFLIDKYLETCTKQLKASTLVVTESTLKKFFKSIENTRINEVDKRIISRILVNEYSYLKKSTANTISSQVRKFMKWCAGNGYIEDSDVPLYFDLSFASNEKNIKHSLSVDRVKKLLNFRSDDVYLECIQFMVITGLRAGELIGLQNCNYYEDYITVTSSIDRMGNRNTTKTENGVRTIPLPSVAKEIINRHRKKVQIGTDNIYAPLFTNKSGTVIKYISLSTANKRLMLQLFNEKYSLHELRHTYITMTRKKSDIDLTELKLLYGHSESMNTEKVYVHELEKTIEEKNTEIEKIKQLKAKINDVFDKIQK